MQIVGCSAQGVITTDGEWENEDAVAVMVLASDTVIATPFFLHSLQNQAEQIGRTIGKISAGGFKEPSHSFLTVVLPDTYTFQHQPFFEGIRNANDKAVVVGGGASEDGSLMQTFQFYQDRILSDAVSGFVLNGP